MRALQRFILGALCVAVPALCQTPSGTYKSNWKGMLVDASCPAAGTTTGSAVPERTMQSSEATRSEQTTDPSATSTETSRSETSRRTDPDTGATTSSSSREKSTAERSSSSDPESGQTTTTQSSRKEKRSSSHSSDTMAQKSSSNPAWDRWMNCPATASTTMFGLVMPDGHLVRFDSVGNLRAQEAFKNNKNWAGKTPLQVKVGGTMDNDKLYVDSIR